MVINVPSIQPFVLYIKLIIMDFLCNWAVRPCHIQEVISQHLFGISTKFFKCSIQMLMTCSQIIIFVKKFQNCRAGHIFALGVRIGCFVDGYPSTARGMSHTEGRLTQSSLTPADCVQRCRDNPHDYAAMQVGTLHARRA